MQLFHMNKRVKLVRKKLQQNYSNETMQKIDLSEAEMMRKFELSLSTPKELVDFIKFIGGKDD